MKPQIVVIYDILSLDVCVFAFVCLQEEVVLTDEEEAIKAYLSDGDPLSPEILDMVIRPYWEQEPYMYVVVRIHRHAHFLSYFYPLTLTQNTWHL